MSETSPAGLDRPLVEAGTNVCAADRPRGCVWGGFPPQRDVPPPAARRAGGCRKVSPLQGGSGVEPPKAGELNAFSVLKNGLKLCRIQVCAAQ